MLRYPVCYKLGNVFLLYFSLTLPYTRILFMHVYMQYIRSNYASYESNLKKWTDENH